ncbi:hypothetical protein FACS189459_3790 [Bacilli bacterium]|nr:hypothetical protein FACS189459_3790 [Bacilli bacterium]
MEAEEYRIHTIERANIDAEEIKLQAQSDIDLIKKQLYINSVNDIVDTAVVISKSIIGDKITKKDNDKLFDMALKNINMSNGTNE